MDLRDEEAPGLTATEVKPLKVPLPTSKPVRLDLIANLQERHARLFQAVSRLLEEGRIHLQGLVRGIPRLDMIVAQKTQDLDALSDRLALGPLKLLLLRTQDVTSLVARLNLDRFARDIDRHGRDLGVAPVTGVALAPAGARLTVEFADGKVGVQVTDGPAAAPKRAKPARKDDGGQGTLL